MTMIWGAVAWRMESQAGTPLSLILEHLDVEWPSYYYSARCSGMDHERIVSRVCEAWSDSGRKEIDEVRKRLDVLPAYLSTPTGRERVRSIVGSSET